MFDVWLHRARYNIPSQLCHRLLHDSLLCYRLTCGSSSSPFPKFSSTPSFLQKIKNSECVRNCSACCKMILKIIHSVGVNLSKPMGLCSGRGRRGKLSCSQVWSCCIIPPSLPPSLPPRAAPVSWGLLRNWKPVGVNFRDAWQGQLEQWRVQCIKLAVVKP